MKQNQKERKKEKIMGASFVGLESRETETKKLEIDEFLFQVFWGVVRVLLSPFIPFYPIGHIGAPEKKNKH
ncbi:hypothetical protein ACFL1O_00590 [Patescibacteria group bacterium]